MKSSRTLVRGLIFVVLLVLVLGVVSGCGSGELKNYVIKIEGTEGATFDGVYMKKVDQAPSSETFSGTVPMEVPVEADEISLQVTKTSTEGSIKVTLTSNGEVVGEQEVSDQGAMIQLSDH